MGGKIERMREGKIKGVVEKRWEERLRKQGGKMGGKYKVEIKCSEKFFEIKRMLLYLYNVKKRIKATEDAGGF